ncbi:hypothetical protein I4U23_022392 [Adineta vaga]|nr:hypothetical protein I4U23_022392 [Adineta vaga]
MFQSNGYKHINCIFDRATIVCVSQLKFVFNSLTNNQIAIGSSAVIRNGLFSDAEANIFRFNFCQYLNESDQQKNIRLTCDENNACGLDLFNEKQRQKQLREGIDLEGQAYKSNCPHHQ